MVRLTSDVNSIKSFTPMSLRIGTRAPLMMHRKSRSHGQTSSKLALTLVPLLVVTSGLIILFVLKTEPLFRKFASQARRAERSLAGKHRWGTVGQSLEFGKRSRNSVSNESTRMQPMIPSA